VRLLTAWSEPADDEENKAPFHDRVEVHALKTDDLFGDAFTAIARDGAGCVEVSTRLQKAFLSLAEADHPAVRTAASRHARLALARSELAMTPTQDLAVVRDLATRVREIGASSSSRS
jgi:uncharacterized membrane protein